MFSSSRAEASATLDRRYSLETIGYLRAWDNMDGLFASYVKEAYSEYFNGETRFKVQDVSKADELLAGSKLPYRKVLEDKKILEQLSRSLKVGSLIRTKVYKEGPRYRFTMEWLHAPKMDVLSEHSLNFEGEETAALEKDQLKKTLRDALDELIGKVPFIAQVTGRDRDWVTVNIGERASLKAGDELAVATLEDVKRHPITRKVVEWRLAPTGRLLVDELDDGIAFCKVLSEEAGRTINRNQKITRIIAAKVKDAPEAESMKSVDQAEAERARMQPPTLGWAGASAWPGFFSREFSDGSTAFESNPFLVGIQGEGEVWLTRNFFVDGRAGYGFFSGGGLLRIQAALGYSYSVAGHFFGPKGWIKLGYRSHAYTLTASSADGTGPSTFTSLVLGLGGDLPLRGPLGLRLELDIGLLPSVTASGFTTSAAESVTDVSFYLGGYYRLRDKMTVRAGLQVHAHTADFADGSVLSQRVISVAPGIVFYF